MEIIDILIRITLLVSIVLATKEMLKDIKNGALKTILD